MGYDEIECIIKIKYFLVYSKQTLKGVLIIGEKNYSCKAKKYYKVAKKYHGMYHLTSAVSKHIHTLLILIKVKEKCCSKEKTICHLARQFVKFE